MVFSSASLPDLATLYVAAAIHPDGKLSEPERHQVIDRIGALFGEDAGAHTAEDAVWSTVESFPAAHNDQVQVIRHVSQSLAAILSDESKIRVMGDLQAIAQSEGVVKESARAFMDVLASVWHIEAPVVAQPIGASYSSSDAQWSVAHDLALVYLGLAHGADDELSRSEVNVMLRTLKVWLPSMEDDCILDVLREAMERYASGSREALVESAVTGLRDGLTADQRRKALADLIRIANADGVFLDDEEDLIIRLQREWGVDPDALYD
jgi:uncharacterized tellurite resistance protein B-like protein